MPYSLPVRCTGWSSTETTRVVRSTTRSPVRIVMNTLAVADEASTAVGSSSAPNRPSGVGVSMLGFGVFRIALLMRRRQLALGKFGVRPTRWWRKMNLNFQYAGAVNLVIAPFVQPRRRAARTLSPRMRALRQDRGTDGRLGFRL